MFHAKVMLNSEEIKPVVLTIVESYACLKESVSLWNIQLNRVFFINFIETVGWVWDHLKGIFRLHYIH